MKTAYFVVCALVSYTAGQQGGAEFKMGGFNAEASTDGKTFQAAGGDFAGKVTTNMRDEFDVNVGDRKDIKMDKMNKMGDDDEGSFDIDSIDPDLLKQLDLSKEDLENATSMDDAVEMAGMSLSNKDWCMDFYPQYYKDGKCDAVYGKFTAQVKQFDAMVANMTGDSDGGSGMKEMREKELKMKNQINIKVDNDFHFKVAMTEDNKFTEMRLKFLDYFDWAMVQGMDKYTNMMDSCEAECGIDEKRDMCCTTVKMYKKGDKNALTQLQCMNTNVVDMSTGIWIEDYFYEYECRTGDWSSNKARSSAQSLAAGAAVSLLAAISFM